MQTCGASFPSQIDSDYEYLNVKKTIAIYLIITAEIAGYFKIKKAIIFKNRSFMQDLEMN
ncbi:MAG TPA: hypothetical protein P5323_02650 [Candidatus Moranbacteria bacterium]|nr:hypothetical protein [Candidatus Moranbacteria bacterium]HSA07913.1 hypothetical protein [Candidatus Moranbacteria bacterium]